MNPIRLHASGNAFLEDLIAVLRTLNNRIYALEERHNKEDKQTQALLEDTANTFHQQ